MGSLLGREHSPPPTSRNECPHGRKTHLVLFPISAFNCSVLECVLSVRILTATGLGT